MRRAVAIAALSCLGWSPGAAGQSKLAYDTYRLDNGLRVFLVEDHSTPVVTVDVWYNVGSRNEQAGRSGFAHLFEHMMFEGTANVAKGQHFQLVERAGGELNGTTNEDRTNYYETLPSNQLSLGLWLEADRMRSLAITDANFQNQRETVKEERRYRVDNQPYGAAFLEGLALPFDSTTCFGYSHSTIGSMADLEAAQTADVKAFFDLYYAPDNATLTVAGDFTSADAKALIQKYFGDLKRGAERPAVSCTVAYASGAKSRTFTDPLANLPAVIVAYRVPGHADPDTRALEILNSILGTGESSRLNASLVRGDRTALQASAGMVSRRGPGLLYVFAVGNQGIDDHALSAALTAQVAKLSDGVDPAELDKARNQTRAAMTFQRQTTQQLAEEIQHYAHFHESVAEINTEVGAFQTLTIDDLKRVAKKYLVPENSYTLTVIPARSAAGDSHQHDGGAR